MLFGIGIVYVFKIVVAPIYALVYSKPLVNHFYVFPKKLEAQHKEWISNHFAFYKRLSPKKQRYFDHRVLNFIKHTPFVSRENIEITFEMKLLVASTSTMLTFGMQRYLYSVIDAIIIYPSSFQGAASDNFHAGEFNPKLKVIVFSWDNFYKGIKISDNNLNLGIHEFSHALLFESTRKKGYGSTSNSIFSDYYTEISNDLKKPEILQSYIESSYFRDYAYLNSVEFIAVILEHFFETPSEFEARFPELYGKVKKMINF